MSKQPGFNPKGGKMPPMDPKQRPGFDMGILKRVLGMLKSFYPVMFPVIIGCIIFCAVTATLPAIFQQQVIAAIEDWYLSGDWAVASKVIIPKVALLAAFYVVSIIAVTLQSQLMAYMTQGFLNKTRQRLFNGMQNLPIKYFDTNKHGDIMSRMTNDVENVSNTVSTSIASLFSAVITLVGTLIVMLSYSWKLTLVALISVPLTIAGTALMSKVMRKYFVRQQRILGSLNSHVEEMVTGYKTVVAYGREERSKEQFAEINRQYRNTAVKANFLGNAMGPMMNMKRNIGYLLVAVAGGYFALKGEISVGVIQAFILYTKQFTRPINEIGNQYSMIINAVAGAERVFEIMEENAENDEDAKDVEPDSVKGNVSFRNVCFAYKKDEPVLRNFDLEVKAGEKIAIVGKTGSGKTTIVNLLTRFYDIDSGEILLDGENINNISKASLRRSIGIVLQDTVLFSDSVEANVKYGRRDATTQELEAALRFSNADIFVERLPEGKDTRLTESGSNLSAGQRQLLAISRAVLLDPKILILDEATSSVDTRTEMQIQSAMQKLMEGRTALIIAHRLSTIRDADRIIVLADGAIAEIGNHDELLALKGEYYNLYMTQFSGLKT